MQSRIKDIQKPSDLLHVENIRLGLISAAGISDKAATHLGEDGCTDAIKEFIDKFLQPAGGKFKEELIFRFLLTKGETLGGKMRNIVGVLAQRKLCISIISALNLSGISFSMLPINSKNWLERANIALTSEYENSKGLSWKNEKGEPRSIFFNVKIPIVNNNIDIIILKTQHDEELSGVISNCENYIALGELKGGIDPAGADEHWKTGKSALDRIKTAFSKADCFPALFFIGAAIENKMAKEIFTNLKSSYLTNAANLTKAEQVTALADWLISL